MIGYYLFRIYAFIFFRYWYCVAYHNDLKEYGCCVYYTESWIPFMAAHDLSIPYFIFEGQGFKNYVITNWQEITVKEASDMVTYVSYMKKKQEVAALKPETVK